MKYADCSITESPNIELCVERNPDAEAWQAFLQTQHDGTLYHDVRWENVFARYGLEMIRLAVRAEGQIVGVLPLVLQRSRIFGRRLASLPWFDTAGILTEDVLAQDVLLGEALRVARECRLDEVHLRQSMPVAGWPAARTDKVLMRLSLVEDSDLIWKGLGPKVRNQVRKAEKSGLQYASGGRELLVAFYDTYSRNMRDLGSPSHSLSFFETVTEEFPDRVRLHVVRHENRTVGAGLTLDNRSVLEIPWASSDRAYNSYCVNHLLYWNIVQEACRRSYRYFHFGRSTIGSGTFHFKKQWGAEAIPLSWYTFQLDGQPKPIDEKPEESFSLARGVWQRLPLRASRWLGPKIIRLVT